LDHENKRRWWHPSYNLLATRRGRLAAFFLLYVTEGIPNGFALVAMVTQMRRLGVSPAEIGAFSAAFTLPWAFKWALGPVVDLFHVDRWGRRRAWIVGAQAMMALTLLAMAGADCGTQLRLLTALVIVHNIFAAAQDVAIDALACGSLGEHERGTANGLMFGGAYLGQGIGGAGVLYLLGAGVSLRAATVLIAGSILAVTALVSVRLVEAPQPAQACRRAGERLAALGRAFAEYAREAGRAFFGRRAAAVGLLVALLPMGPYALMLPLANNLAVELGLSVEMIAHLTLAGTVIAALACVLGGYLSDRWGRRRMLVLYVLGMVACTLALAWGMHQQGWLLPVEVGAANKPVPSALLVNLYIGTGLVFALFQGLMYGTRTALFMDVCNPAVAATQFTAYMALLNVVISYSTYWQCRFITALGYPRTLALDAGLGLVCLLLLPLMTKHGGGGKK
jgi:PAT family beta-lactamase induction signal transducer AmpG